MAKVVVGPDPYRLDAKFERQITALCCDRPAFFGTIADALDPACLATPEAQLLVAAAREHFRVTGNGPADEALVFQRLRSLVAEGKITVEQVTACEAYYHAGAADLATTRAGYEHYLAALAPTLKKRVEMDALKKAAQAHGAPSVPGKSGGSAFLDALEMARRSGSIGKIDISVGTMLDGAMEAIAGARDIVTLSTGVPELDEVLGGGLPRPGFGYVLGDPNSGKSMALSQFAGWALTLNQMVCYATLELSVPRTYARVVADLCDTPINDVMAGRKDDVLRQRLSGLALAPMFMQAFPGNGTTLADIFTWVKRCEGMAGRSCDLLVVDYADKLGSSRRERDSLYLTGKETYEGLFQWSNDCDSRVWTASQTKNRKGASKTALRGLGESADSMHKDRAADIGVSINLDEDRGLCRWHVFRHRLAESGLTSADLPTNFVFGRVTPRKLHEKRKAPPVSQLAAGSTSPTNAADVNYADFDDV